MPQNGGNGHSREYNLAIVETLVFPDMLSEEQCEEYRNTLRRFPEYLNYLVDVGELYEYLMATPHVARETKEQFVAGLQHYAGDEGTAYAVMLGLYAAEVASILLDVDGAHTLHARMSTMSVIDMNAQQ